MNSLILRFLRLILRVRRILINLRLQVYLDHNLRIRRNTKRLIFNNNTLDDNHTQITNHDRCTNTNNNRLDRSFELIKYMPLSNVRRIQSRINTLLRLRISLHPAILRAILRHRRIIVNTSTPAGRSGSGGSGSGTSSRADARLYSFTKPYYSRSSALTPWARSSSRDVRHTSLSYATLPTILPSVSQDKGSPPDPAGCSDSLHYRGSGAQRCSH